MIFLDNNNNNKKKNYQNIQKKKYGNDYQRIKEINQNKEKLKKENKLKKLLNNIAHLNH